MADLTHAPFRQLVADFGGCGLFYTEMLNSRMVARGDLDRDPYCKLAVTDRPLVAQLVGNDPQRMAIAAKRLADHGVDAIDINMGCCRQAIMRHGWGFALMEDAGRVEQVVKAVRREVALPLLVKLRSGREHRPEKLVVFCKRLVELGVDAVCLHPRSLADGFKRPARWAEIGELARELSVPVIGNGDVADRETACSMMQQTGCRAVMLGRAALVRPWIFAEIAGNFRWDGNAGDLLERFLEYARRYLPQEMVRNRLLLFCSWFFRNWQFYMPLLQTVRACCEPEEMVEAAVRYLEAHEQQILRQPFFGRL